MSSSDFASQETSVHPLAVLRPARKPRVYTLAEYLKKEEESSVRHHYYNGIIHTVPMAKGPHNIICANLIAALHHKIIETGADLTIFNSHQKVYMPALNVGLYPDALVISEQPQYWDTNEVLLINPLLIAEVLSPSTKKYDRSEKFNEYYTLDSFKEYILIDQERMHIEVRFREAPDLWRYTRYSNDSDQILLKSIGCTLSMAEVYWKVM
jgi:Uma2 family endonuclease